MATRTSTRPNTRTRRPVPRSQPDPAAAPESPQQPADPGGDYREVALADLSVNPLNLRRRQTGIDELAQSIRAVGVLEPLLVTPTDDHGLLIVAGHRRHAAAAQAGQHTVPCIVRTMDEAQIIQATLIENGHRENLTYLEEAEGLRRLMDLTALSIRDLAARVGRPPAYVSGRLSLLALPGPVQAALDNATITLDTAIQVTDLIDYPEVIDNLLDTDGRIDPDRLRRARSYVTVERDVARLTAEATAKGLRLVELQPGNRYLSTLDLSPAQHGAHRRQSCHAVILDRSYDQPRLTPICANPARHQPPPAPAAAPADEATTPVDASQQPAPAQPNAYEQRRQAAAEDERNRKRVAKARRAFLHHALGRRIKRAEAAVFVFASVLTRANHTDLSQAGALLGLTAEPDQYGQKDWRAAITTYATADADQLLKAAFAVAATWAETRISPHSDYDTTTAAYVNALARLGYTPDPYETQHTQPEPDTTQHPGASTEPADDQPAPDEPTQPEPAGDSSGSSEPLDSSQEADAA